ncbi:MAG: putative exporter [Candidatus Marinamargulisbacteria bacterium]
MTELNSFFIQTYDNQAIGRCQFFLTLAQNEEKKTMSRSALSQLSPVSAALFKKQAAASQKEGALKNAKASATNGTGPDQEDVRTHLETSLEGATNKSLLKLAHSNARLEAAREQLQLASITFTETKAIPVTG